MDQAALQRVTLVRTSGTLCWTVWSAREQQSLRTWIVSFFLGSAVNQLAHSSGEWSLLWISGWPSVFLLCCNALQVLCWDEDTLGAPEQFCRYFSVWRRRDNAYFDDESIAAASISTTTRCWLCLIVPGTVCFLTWHGSHIHPETHKFLVAGYGWSLT